MTIKTAYSTNPDPNGAAQELLRDVGDLDLRFVAFFASPAYAPEQLGKALAQTFGQVPSIGCTTAGELFSGKMLKRSVVLIAFDAASLRAAHVALVEEMKSEESVSAALDALAGAVGKSASER